MTTDPSTEPAHAPVRVLKTLLVTDLVDSTALVNSLGDRRAAAIFEDFERTARDLLERYNGLEIDKADGFLLIFDRPIDAICYALAVHRALAGFSKEHRVKLAVRAGIHLGEVVMRKNRPEHVSRGAKPVEVEGLAKPMAARIMSLAQGSQTLMTRTAFDLARRAAVDHTEIAKTVEWHDHGVYRLKGIEELQPVFEVGEPGIAPCAPPPPSDKAWRVRERSTEGDLSWRPGAGEAVPDRDGWRLERKLGETRESELWLGRAQESVSFTDRTIGMDSNVASLNEPAMRAFLFCRTAAAGEPGEERLAWQLSDPVSCLVVISGIQEGAFVVLTRKTLACGRDATADLRINDRKVSRQHFEIHADQEGYVLRELNPTNGVYVNGERMRERGEHRLAHGDEIRIGDNELVFYEDDDKLRK